MEKVILVTGGSGGIGAATAESVAKQGLVVVHYNGSLAKAAEVVEKIVSAGGQAVALRADLTVEHEVCNLFAEVDKIGRLTALVNNAGVITPIAPFTQYDAERIERVMKVNVLGPMLCAREAVKRMSTDNGGVGGTIVNVSSAASRLGSPNEFIDYAASKGALDTFTLGLSKEVGPQGIRVNAVRPGLIDTEMHSLAGFPDRCAAFRDKIPLAREGLPMEVAAAITWLLSKESGYVSGALLDVSGGR